MFSRIFFLLCLFYLPFSFANSYVRGDIYCEDFQKAKNNYENVKSTGGYAVTYAGCLLARGKKDDVRALTILEVEADRRQRVPAAQLLALYTATGGTMEHDRLDKDNYNEAFQAYGAVIHLIEQHPNYPKGFEITEANQQHELEAYYYLVQISYEMFFKGLNGSYHAYLLQSPTYDGDRGLSLYPQYSPYTVASLKQTRDNADICTDLPKKAHFQPLLYKRTIRYCEMMGQIARRYLVLEEERLALLNNESCARDVELCSEYQELVFNEMVPLNIARKAKSTKIWNSTEQELDDLDSQIAMK